MGQEIEPSGSLGTSDSRIQNPDVAHEVGIEEYKIRATMDDLIKKGVNPEVVLSQFESTLSEKLKQTEKIAVEAYKLADMALVMATLGKHKQVR